MVLAGTRPVLVRWTIGGQTSGSDRVLPRDKLGQIGTNWENSGETY